MRTGWPQILTMLIACGVAAGCGSKHQTLYSPPQFGNTTNPPAVRLIMPADGFKFHAHKDIRLLALATPNGSDLGPDDDASRRYADTSKWDLIQDRQDTYSVEFLSGTNSLNTQITGIISAKMKSKPGQAEPMHMIVVGYPSVEWVWHDPPVGSYTLMAKVTNGQGLATISAPVNITVLP